MVKEKLQVYARVKPTEASVANTVPFLSTPQTITIDMQRGKLSNAKEQHDFSFNHVFSPSTQPSVFQNVAKPVIDNGLDGYNGTIFAYGQTGSGKTYTMSGGQKWQERGIIPRVLQYVFEEFQRRSASYQYTLTISFVQIYNENAYDLLKEEHGNSNFQNWSKIIFMEDEDSNLQMKNVETHPCDSQEKGIQLLMMGNYLRKINSTSLNQASSRSHCIFTLNIKGKNLSTLAQVYSKIHLVDLAGSERVSKSQAQGLVLTQAKSINLSLTYLEQVIVALNQKSKGKGKQHIPYRNSLLTMLLKDSLGGNCKTVMIATISIEMNNIEESFSTLRFSQRVKQIQNQISKNEKNIYSHQIESLEKENLMLRKRLAKFEKQNCEKQEQKNYDNDQNLKLKIDEFISKKKTNLDVNSLGEAQFCFQRMRDLYNKKMREYATQLTFISEKLEKYDEILSRKENRKKNILTEGK